MITTEEWRGIPGLEHRYEVSSHGRVRSKDMKVRARNCFRTFPGRIRKPANSNGYQYISLYDNGKLVLETGIHRLVMRAFVGECPEGKEVLHSDDDRANNHLSNLSYGTRKENMEGAEKRGRTCKGEKQGQAKIPDISAPIIRWMYEISSLSHADLANLFGVSSACIGRLIRRDTYTHV